MQDVSIRGLETALGRAVSAAARVQAGNADAAATATTPPPPPPPVDPAKDGKP